jgi:predicted permease
MKELPMKLYVVMAMIIVGALFILAPIAAHEYSKERNRDSIAQFYARNGNAASLPVAMQSNYGPYDYVCLIAGVCTLGLGIFAAGIDYLGVPAAAREMIAQRSSASN